MLGSAEAERYGLPAGMNEVVLGVEGAAGGRVRIIATPLDPDTYSPYAPRAEALDLYSSDCAPASPTRRTPGTRRPARSRTTPSGRCG